MASPKDPWRWLGGMALLASVAMLICGETVLKGRLDGLGLLAYWLACFGLTTMAMVLALRDLRAQRRRAREARRELLESTIRAIDSAARARARDPAQGTAAKDEQRPD